MAGNPIIGTMNANSIVSSLQNNPFMQIINMVRSGSNPMEMIGRNPQLQQIAGMMNGKNPNEIGGMINSLAQQKGVDVGQLAKSIGMPEEIAKQYGIKM